MMAELASPVVLIKNGKHSMLALACHNNWKVVAKIILLALYPNIPAGNK